MILNPPPQTGQMASAKMITKLHGKTFFFASLFLDREKRAAAYSVYAVCRTSDDIVDGSTRASAATIEAMRDRIQDAYAGRTGDDPIMREFHKTVTRYKIPIDYFHELIAGMHMDLDKKRYRSFEELYDYCYKVAGVIGLIMLMIFDGPNTRAAPYAVKLGVAMQLTNIIRDIKEDYGLKRVYLPSDDLERFGVTESDIARGHVNENIRRLIAFEIERARDYYAQSQPGIKMIKDKRCRFVVQVMKDLYAGILDSAENRQMDVFSQRAFVTMPRKVLTTARIAVSLIGAQ